MIGLKKTICHITIYLVALLAITNTLLAQETLRYSGPYRIASYSGNASFDYLLENNDTIFHGPFQMQRSNLGALLEKRDSTFSLKGEFEHNYPNGKWNFQFGEFQSDKLTEVVGLQYKLNVSGKQEEASGDMVLGKPDGPWTYIINSVKNSEIDKTLFKSTIEFEQGIPQKSFLIEDTKATLVGRFLRDGLAHDEWVQYAENDSGISESWFFNNGFLEKIRLKNEGEAEHVIPFKALDSMVKIISLDERYLSVLKLSHPKLGTSKAFKQGIQRLLKKNSNYYSKIDDILNELGESSFLPKFKVKVAYFPMTEDETSKLNAIANLYDSVQKTSYSLLSDTQLNILKVSDNEAGHLYQMIETIANKMLGPIGKMVQCHQQDILEYVNREQLISQLWPNGLTAKEIQNLFAQTAGSDKPIFATPEIGSYDFSGNNIVAVHQLMEYVSSSLASIEEHLNDKLVNERRAQEFESLESSMIDQIKKLNQSIDSVNNEIPGEHIKALEQIKAYADERLRSYSNTTDLEEKLNLGRNLVVCFEHLITLGNIIANVSDQQEELEKTYQDQVWNPFMANLMTEDVKKRIVTAYRKVLIPYIIESTTANIDCENVEGLSVLATNIHQRMLELREEDTRKLERKLKKVQDPFEVMRLLNIAKGTLQE